MGALRDRFWELPLAQLNKPEWEALCDGCGRCCLHKIEYEDTGEIDDTNVACTLLDCQTARCTNYANRKTYVPDCLRLTPKLVDQVRWLPDSCAYRLRADGDLLPEWHYLISESRETVIEAGVSVAGRVISEDEAGPIEHHIVEWPEYDPDWPDTEPGDGGAP